MRSTAPGDTFDRCGNGSFETLTYEAMAVGPGGVVLEGAGCPELSAEEVAFARGLEGIIDRALAGVRPGERFVYGIHQALPERISACVVRRYLAAGWAEATILPGATGAATLVLAP